MEKSQKCIHIIFLKEIWCESRKASVQKRYNTWWHDDVIKWKHFPRYWPFVWGIHQSPVNSPHKGQWRGALVFSLICARINGWVNNDEASDLWRHRTHYDVTVMKCWPYRAQERDARLPSADSSIVYRYIDDIYFASAVKTYLFNN